MSELDPAIPLGARSFSIGNPFLEAFASARQMRAQKDAQQALIDERKAQTEERQRATEAARRAQYEEQSLAALFGSGETIDPKRVYSIVGPKRGAEIMKGISALQEQDIKTEDALRSHVGTLVGGILALPEGMRPQAYTHVRSDLIGKQLVTPDQVPEQYDPNYVMAARKWALTPKEQLDQEAQAARDKIAAATAAAQLPGQVAQSAIQQQVAAGMKGGLTPEQQRTAQTAQGQLAVSQGQLAVAKQREAREQASATAAAGGATQDLPPGSRDYRVAKDLASGDLTYSQFLRLYPSRSGATSGLKAAIYDKARDLNPEFTPAAFEAGYKFATNPKTVAAVAAVDNVLPNIKKIVDLSNSWDRTKYPDLNKFLGAAQFKLGDTTIANIRQAQKLIGDELGTALGGGAMTDMKLQLGLDVVDPNVSPDTFMSNMARVEEFLQNRKASLKTPMGRYANQNATPQAAAPGAGAATEEWVRDPKTNKLVKKGGS